MKKKTSQRSIEQGQELSDAELEQAVGGTGLQEAVGGFVPAGSSAVEAGEIAPTATPEDAAMMQLQMAMQRENPLFSTISNVLKARHDTAKNSINNIR